MQNDPSGLRWGMLFLGGSLAVGLIVATHLATRSLMKTKLVEQTIGVKGFAEKKITSDRAAWAADFGVSDPSLTAAYAKLQRDLVKVQAFLDTNGAKKDAVTLGPVSIRTIFKKDDKGNTLNDIDRYWLVQPIQVDCEDVRLVEKIARGGAKLIEEGVELRAEPPQYIYTKLNSLKADLLAEATRNAKDRATQIASNSGAAVGPLRSARQGVFQITPVYSTEVSGSGENDTTSLEKVVRCVVTTEFAIP